MDKKKFFLWCLYTFANSIVFINFLVYFSKWIVLDGGISNIAYNSVFVFCAILLLLSGPALAEHSDKNNSRKSFLNIATVGTIISYLGASLCAVYNVKPLIALVFFILGQFFYQMSFIFYDPLINDLSDEKNRGRASGIGQFCSNFGMIAGLGISLPLIESGGRLSSLIPSVFLFAILASPLMIFYKTKNIKQKKPEKIKLGFDYKKFRSFVLTSAAAPVLISFFFYTNALNTITNNYSIFAGAILNMSDSMTSIVLIVVQIAASVGALLIGIFGDKFGMKKCLMYILWTWLILIPFIAFANDINLFFVLAGILGLSIGSGWAASRAYISTRLEDDNVGYGFSFYTLSDRFSSMIGPLVWGGIIAIGAGYRIAMLSMAMFIAIGIIVLRVWKK